MPQSLSCEAEGSCFLYPFLNAYKRTVREGAGVWPRVPDMAVHEHSHGSADDEDVPVIEEVTPAIPAWAVHLRAARAKVVADDPHAAMQETTKAVEAYVRGVQGHGARKPRGWRSRRSVRT